MKWDKTHEELLRNYSLIDTSFISDPKLIQEEKTNALTTVAAR